MFEKMKRKLAQLFLSPKKYAVFLGVQIGDGCSIGTKCFGSEPYLIKIGNNVQITSNVKFVNHGGAWLFRTKNKKFDFFGKIEIKDNVYIGNNSTILPGVTINSNVIVAAGSIVSKSVEENSIIGGNPAKVIGSVSDLKSRMDYYNTNTKGLSYKDKKNELLNNKSINFISK